jgi:hypothetical protein
MKKLKARFHASGTLIGTDMLFRNVCVQPPTYTAQHHRTATTSRILTQFLVITFTFKVAFPQIIYVCCLVLDTCPINSNRHGVTWSEDTNQKISTQVRTSVYWVSACHECAARRCTHWHHVIVVKHHAAVRQGVNVGRRHLVRPMETDVVPTLQQHQVDQPKMPHKQTYMSA